ncbi:MAG: type II toxin-antitoxin system PemK/MazF family toxin [Deltaproteobacteria bacterium]|nr:type II toxin-antitoxin system PemK/MazF family toxin [Deltaproteobacteria bacterium]
MVVRRGQIWWVDFGRHRASEPAYRHPALVVQRDEVNLSRIETTVVCLLTSNLALARAPGNTLLPRRSTGLPKDSVANVSQLATVNKTDLERLVATLRPSLIDAVDRGLSWMLRLGDE